MCIRDSSVHRDPGGLIRRIAVHPGADGREGRGAAAQLQGQSHGVSIAVRQQFCLPMPASVPHGTHCVDDVSGGQAVASSGLGLAGGDVYKRQGLVRSGEQRCQLEILDGRFQGRTVTGINMLNGSLEQDKLFSPCLLYTSRCV